MRIRLSRVLAAGAATLVAAGVAVLGSAVAASAADIGTLTVNPASGGDDSPLSVSTSGACPGNATTIQVTIKGTGFPAAGFNIVGATSLANVPTNGNGGYDIIVSDTLRNYAAQQTPPATLSGNYTITTVCRTALSATSLGDFPGVIQFTSPTTYITPAAAVRDTTTTLAASATSIAPGGSVTFTATVAPATGTGGPGGTVQFKDGAANLGATVAVASGTAALTTTALTALGDHPITAVYSGDSTFGTSTSAATHVTVASAPLTATNTGLGVNPGGPVDPGAQVTLTATVAPATGTGSPSGTVQFKDGANNVGSPVALAGGTATASTSALATGNHQLTAVYSGDSTFAASTSAAVPLVVNAPANGGSETINVTVPAGALSLTIANASVTLPDLQLNPGNTMFSTSGPINPATVTDTRAGNPGWTVSGQISDFTGPGSINGANLGWTPAVADKAASQTVTAGSTVAAANGLAPGATAGDPAQGLKTARTLATAAAGAGLGTAHVSAGLTLNAPTSTPAGSYSATLTLTAI
ncbi:MAG: hypothetical protein V7637_2920 [Mycobacteriales bacterium]